MTIHEIKLNATEHKKFCEVMHKRMAEQGLTVSTLAGEIGVATQSIYNFEKDTTRNPSKYLAGKIATRLEITQGDYRAKGSFF